MPVGLRLSYFSENERRLFYVALTRAKKAVFIGTVKKTNHEKAPVPSRFLEEIQLQPTIEIMEPLQQLAARNSDVRPIFLKRVNKYRGYRKITDNLLSGYLRDIDDLSLIDEIARVVTTSEAVSFVYSSAYRSQKQANSKPPLSGVWGDVLAEKPKTSVKS